MVYSLVALYEYIIITPKTLFLGRPLGYFIFSLIGFNRTIFRNIFQRV